MTGSRRLPRSSKATVSVGHEELAIQIETRKHETRFVDLERVAGRNLGGAAQINADSSGHARAPRRRPAADFTLPCRRRPNSRSPRPPTGDRRAALLVITVDLYLIPHAVYAIRIGTGEGVHGGAVLGANHEYAAHGSLAVISNECARSHNVDIVVDGVIEMNAVGAIEFGPCGQHVRLVDGVNDEEHSRSLPASCQKRKFGRLPSPSATQQTERSVPRRAGQAFSGRVVAASGYERHVLVPVIRVVEACARRIGIHDADLDHDRFPAFHFVARPYFAGSSLILLPPFAKGMTQSGVATSAELRSVV